MYQDRSVISGFHIGEEMRKKILSIMPGNWRVEGFKYLGIKICRSKEAIVKENIVPLINYIQEKCQLWNYYPLSWLGKIVAVKMVLLSKLVFVFLNMSLDLPDKILGKIQGILNKFHLWQ